MLIALLTLMGAACADEGSPSPPHLSSSARATAEQAVGDWGYVMPACQQKSEGEFRQCANREAARWLYVESSDPTLARWVRYLQEYRDWKDAQGIRYQESTDTMIVVAMTMYAASDSAESTLLTFHFIVDPKDFWTDGETSVVGYSFGFHPGRVFPLDASTRSYCARDERRCATYTDAFSLRSAQLWADDPRLPNPPSGPSFSQGIDDQYGVLSPMLRVDPTWITDTYRHP